MVSHKREMRLARSVVVRLASLCVAFGTACSAHRYHARLNASTPAQSVVCEVSGGETTSDGSVSPTTDANCAPLGANALFAPGQLTVTAVGARPGASYSLSIEEHLAGNGNAAAADVLDEFLRRVGRLAGPAADALTQGIASGADEATREQIDQIADRVGGALGQVIHERTAAALGPPTGTRRLRALDQFGEGENVEQALARPAAAFHASEPGMFRVVELDATDVAALTAEGLSPHELADAIVRQCDDAGWGELAPGGPTLLQYLGAGDTPDEAAVLAAIGFEPDTVRSFLAGGDAVGFDARIEALLAEVQVARQANQPPTGHAATIERLFVEARLDDRLTVCAANLEFLSRPAVLALGDDDRTRLAATAREVAALAEHTERAARLYAILVAPAVTVVAADVVTRLASSPEVEFGTFPIHPGRVDLALTSAAGDGAASGLSLINAELEVRDSPWVAVSVGGLVSLCADCFVSVDEVDVPASGSMAARRVIRQTASPIAGGAAVSLHVSLVALGDHHLGLMVGYPLAESSGTEATVLLGGSYRFALVGLQIGLGLQVFETHRIRDGAREVDLSAPGNADLRVPDVVSAEPAAAFFLMIGLSSDLIFTLSRH